MATRTKPATCYRYLDESEEVSSAGSGAFRYMLIGLHSVLETFARSLEKGDNFSDALEWVVDNWNLQRRPGDIGLLTVNCNPADADSTLGQIALDETWTIKTVRNDCSILAYCGASGANPQRAVVEAWQKEPDGELAEQLQYAKPDGSLYTVPAGSATADLIDKIRKGIDTVMRFYPQLTKTRTYSTMPTDVFLNMCTIDTPRLGILPPSSGSSNADARGFHSRRITKPGNLEDIIEAYSWLKCQDDAAATADGKYQRIESWMGTPANPGWDVNLYGTGSNRWGMPYFKQQQQQQPTS